MMKKLIGRAAVILVLATCMISTAGPAAAQNEVEIHLKGTCTFLDSPYGLSRLGYGVAQVTTGLVTTPYPINHGLLELSLTVTEGSEVGLQITSGWTDPTTFYFSLDSSGQVAMRESTGAWLVELEAGDDGVSFFEFTGNKLMITRYVEQPGPVLGFTRGDDLVTRTEAPAAWDGRQKVNGGRIIRNWRYADDLGRAPGIVRRITRPDGTESARYYPLGGEGYDPDGNWWTTRSNPQVEAVYFRAEWFLMPEFVQGLGVGRSTVTYWLVSPDEEQSNTRVEFIDYYPRFGIGEPTVDNSALPTDLPRAGRRPVGVGQVFGADRSPAAPYRGGGAAESAGPCFPLWSAAARLGRRADRLGPADGRG